MALLVGIDIGTQGVKAAIYASSGERVAEAFEPSSPRRPAPGVVEEEPEFQLASTCRVLQQCVEQSGTSGVAAIAVTGQMAGVVGIGADGRAVTPYDSWLDTRCGAQISRMQNEAGPEVLRLTGNAPSFNHGPKILWWKTERPSDYAGIAKFVQPGGYVAMRLCGLGADDAFIDTSYLHFSGFADNRAKRWDAALCERFNIEVSKLPRILEPTVPISGLTAEMAGACGLAQGTPVIAGCGDTAASFLSCDLNALAAAVTPHNGSPMFLPHLGGRNSPAAPALRGAWVGLTWDHTRGELFRAMLESVALEYAIYQQAVRKLLPDAAFTELRITGGGEKSAVWNQIKADVLQMPIVQIQNGGGAPMGAAMLAGVGAGVFASLPEGPAIGSRSGSALSQTRAARVTTKAASHVIERSSKR